MDCMQISIQAMAILSLISGNDIELLKLVTGCGVGWSTVSLFCIVIALF